MAPLLLLCGLMLCAAAASSGAATVTAPIDAAGVEYRALGAGAELRNVSAALNDRISVRDFGARGSCDCAKLRKPMALECCPDDDTHAFTSALAAGAVRSLTLRAAVQCR